MKTKQCTKCGEVKPFSEYHKDKNKELGITSRCKPCSMIDKYKSMRTKNGVVNTIYSTQLHKSRERGHAIPSYTNKELKEWMFSQKIFHELYDIWKASGYDTMLKPSCDRNNDYEGYSLEGITIMTWDDNNKKACSDRRNGVLTKQAKAVISTNKITGVEKSFYSMSQAAKELNLNQGNISNCINGYQKSTGCYMFRFKT